MDNHPHTIVTGTQILQNWIMGISGSIIAVITPLQDQIMWWAQFAAVVGGLTLTTISIVRAIQTKSKK